MQFRVPQFIDVEDKIVGPFTLKQFGYLLGAAGFSFLIWTFIPIRFIAFLLIVPVSGFFIALAFVKINNRPFADVLENAFAYYTGSKVYTWQQPSQESIGQSQSSDIDKVVQETKKEITIMKANKGKLHDIALGLDVFESNSQNKEDI